MTERDLELQDEFNAQLPIIPHSDFGADCCGCIVVAVTDEKATYVCNECFASVSAEDVHRVASEMPHARATCSHCGFENVFFGFTEMIAFICQSCGQGVLVKGDHD